MKPMTRIFRTLSIALLMAGCLTLTACKSAPPKPKVMKLNVAVSADANPDAQNRPSPIVIRIYQLKDDAAFKDADFFFQRSDRWICVPAINIPCCFSSPDIVPRVKIGIGEGNTAGDRCCHGSGSIDRTLTCPNGGSSFFVFLCNHEC